MIVVVGDTHTNPPFTSPHDIIVRTWLKQAGIHPVYDVAYVVTSDACAGNVDWLKPKWTLCIGQRALTALCPVRSVTIGNLHGHCWSTKSGTAMATYAPNKHGELGGVSAEDVRLFGECVRGDVVPALGWECVRCHKMAGEVAVFGLLLCRKCKRFARPVVEQPALFEMRVENPT